MRMCAPDRNGRFRWPIVQVSKRCIIASSTAAMLLMAGPGIAASGQDENPVIIKTAKLTMDTALDIARAAISACREKGLQVAVTVVDRAGQPQVVLRDVLAVDLTLEVSRQKAYTAMSFNAATSTLAGRFSQPFSVAKVDGVLPAPGGVPITAAGSTVGGVGVSGAPSGEQDEECAQAGIDEVEMDLEMAGF